MEPQYGILTRKKHFEKLEKIQRRGARFINKDYISREEGCRSDFSGFWYFFTFAIDS
jgi:hypothetical protein